MQEDGLTIHDLIQSYGEVRPREVPTLYTIMKSAALPALGLRASSSELARALCRKVPAHKLYGLMDSHQDAWHPRLQRRLPDTTTHQKAYFRALRRLIVHGETRRLIHPEQYAISPDWRFLLERVYALTRGLPVKDRSFKRSAFKKLAKWATSNRLAPESPGSIPAAAFSKFRETFPAQSDGNYFRARQVWNLLVEASPELGLERWDGAISQRAIPLGEWPLILIQGLDDLFMANRLSAWSKSTKDGYVSQLGIYLGTLRDLGVDIGSLVGGLSSGQDAFRILFQGLPPDRPEVADPLHHYPRAQGDCLALAFRMRELAGTYEGTASRQNPFLMAAVDAFVDSGRITTALNLVRKVLALNRGFLGITERHVGWCRQLFTRLQLLARRMPSSYALKKRAYFKDPELWARLVTARSRLREHTLTLERAFSEAMGARAVSLKRRWAVALRNEVYFGLVLCYPLRARHFSEMRLGTHFDPLSHRLYFAAEETKNQREIDYELPSGGSLGDLRQLTVQYLAEARPVLLSGQESPYLFVPCRKGVRIPTRGFNLILSGLCSRFLSDLLPESYFLNPHMLRHVAASFHLGVGGNLNLAAQILNDAPSTITKSYADVLESKKEATKRFLSSFNAHASIPPID